LRALTSAVTQNDERARLEASVKASDGFFTTFFVSPYSKYIARWAARRGLTPNQVTLASGAVGALAAAAFAAGHRPGLVAGAVLLQAAFTLDCVDGQLARYTRAFSRFGAWLDSIFDRVKEYLVYAGLAIGASRAGDPAWLLAGSALALQTARHAVDLPYPTTRPAAARAAARPGPLGWAKKVLAFPIGERLALISLTAALFSPRVTFLALLAWGGFAAAYVLVGRTLRALPA
jgi:phosphatidylglycerophosphate synthase